MWVVGDCHMQSAAHVHNDYISCITVEINDLDFRGEINALDS